MINNDNHTSDYDITIMKKNISELMKDRGITQNQLAEAAGMNQSRVSKILNLETSDCFTIQQLVSIARALHVSTDSILGIKEKEHTEPNHEPTLADLCTKLFEINDLAPVHFGMCENGSLEYDNFTGESTALLSPCIFFNIDSISDFISEWNGIKHIDVKDITLKANIRSTWEKGIIAESKSKLKKYQFQEKNTYRYSLAASLVNDIEDGTMAPFLPDDHDLLMEYIGSGDYKNDFYGQSQNMLLDWFEDQKRITSKNQE